MKIRCYITSVEDVGDKVAVKLQGAEETASEWRSESVLELLLDNKRDIGRRFWVGREVDIEVALR